MYATRDWRIKTDMRDARALCEACPLGAYRPAYRTSDRQGSSLSARGAHPYTLQVHLADRVAGKARGLPHQGGPSPSFARRVEEAHTLE
jgi:hypothetical protein